MRPKSVSDPSTTKDCGDADFLTVGDRVGHYAGSNKTTTPSPEAPAALETPESSDPAVLGNTPVEDSLAVKKLADPYLHAIMEPSDKNFSRLECPSIKKDRYKYLAEEPAQSGDERPRYLFALDIFQIVKLLPRLLGSTVETMRFLGPKNCVLSIVEGHSDDLTSEVLSLLQPRLAELGIDFVYTRSDINTTDPGRIKKLAKLRNMALQPLYDDPARFHPDVSVVFLNDIAVCPNDILELVHQKVRQGAHMTCAMDWHYMPDETEPVFYDVWISRAMTGESFFRVTDNGGWDNSHKLFEHDDVTRKDWEKGRPFQVFACWNGVTVFTGKGFTEKGMRFRKNIHQHETFQGEVSVFAKDMWNLGYNKICVVPTVNVAYDDEKGKMIRKGDHPWSRKPAEGDLAELDKLIEWQEKPPEKVRVMPMFVMQQWQPWNEGLDHYEEAMKKPLDEWR